MDAYTFCLLATDEEDVNSYKVIKFNPCNKYEETIAGQLPSQHDCAVVSLEGKIQQLQILASRADMRQCAYLLLVGFSRYH